MLEKKDGKLILSEDKIAKVVGEISNRYSAFVKIYKKAKPLFDESIISEVQKLIDDEKAESNDIVKALYSGQISNISNLMRIRITLEEKLQESIVIQLRRLIQS